MQLVAFIVPLIAVKNLVQTYSNLCQYSTGHYINCFAYIHILQISYFQQYSTSFVRGLVPDVT